MEDFNVNKIKEILEKRMCYPDVELMDNKLITKTPFMEKIKKDAIIQDSTCPYCKAISSRRYDVVHVKKEKGKAYLIKTKEHHCPEEKCSAVWETPYEIEKKAVYKTLFYNYEEERMTALSIVLFMILILIVSFMLAVC